MLIAIWTLDFIWLTLPEAPRLAIELDTHVLLYTGAVCVLATVLFGLIPALHGTRLDITPLLKSDTPAASGDVKRGVRMRRFFLITQFASSMALVVVAGTFVRTIVATHLGEQSAAMDHIAVAGVETDLSSGPVRAAHWRSVREALQRLPERDGRDDHFGAADRARCARARRLGTVGVTRSDRDSAHRQRIYRSIGDWHRRRPIRC